jgi:hypothetical protein
MDTTPLRYSVHIPNPRPALTKRLSELYPGGGFKLNTESEKKFLFHCTHYRSDQTQKVVQLVLRRSMQC